MPLGLLSRTDDDRPIDVTIASSPIDLGLVAGITDVIASATGKIRIDMHAVGTSLDPHFDGSVDLTDAGFVVTATGVPYKNGRAAIRVSPDRVTVETLHLEDSGGRPLDISGSRVRTSCASAMCRLISPRTGSKSSETSSAASTSIPC